MVETLTVCLLVRPYTDAIAVTLMLALNARKLSSATLVYSSAPSIGSKLRQIRYTSKPILMRTQTSFLALGVLKSQPLKRESAVEEIS